MTRQPRLLRSTLRALLAAALFGGGLTALLSSGARAGAHPHAAASAPYAPGVVIVGLRPRQPRAVAERSIARSGLARTTSTAADIETVRLRPHVSVTSAAAALRRSAGVAWAVPDYIAHAAQAPVPIYPDDPGSSGEPGGWRALQWNFAGPFSVNAPQAWANVAAAGHPGGAGVIVAVLDTGVAYANHGPFVRSPDFDADEFVRGHDFVTHSAYPEDRNGHGTQVAGTIAEETDNGVGVTGLAYGVKLMPLRVLDSEGNGDASTIAEGIRWAVDHHAQIINLSLEFTAGTVRASSIPELIEAIDYALSHNVLVVAASGNEGMSQISYPAKVPGVVAVGATTADGCLAYYSNHGPGLTLVAPGGGTDAAVADDPHCHPATSTDSYIYQETFASLDAPHYRSFGLPSGYYGTSMAAPHVSATAALIIASGVLGAHPTIAAIIQQLEQTATKLGTPADSRYYGAGLVNAAAATEPIASTGPTGPSGTTGVSGST